MKRHKLETRVAGAERYVVRGALPFPLDMLRYDSAWPATSTDAAEIGYSLSPDRKRGNSEVTVYARRPLTSGRWQSFGWTVMGHYDEVPR